MFLLRNPLFRCLFPRRHRQYEHWHIYEQRRFKSWRTKDKKLSKTCPNPVPESEHQSHPGFAQADGCGRRRQGAETRCSKITSCGVCSKNLADSFSTMSPMIMFVPTIFVPRRVDNLIFTCDT